jgi:isopentenyl-diphosphate Delta-isomerase
MSFYRLFIRIKNIGYPNGDNIFMNLWINPANYGKMAKQIRNMEKIILVDEKNRETGYEEKMAVHEKGLLHRAFSIFVFNEKNELLLQKREKAKYHSGGLWTNTCCSHPREGETLELVTHRRLLEEMGFDCDLAKLFEFRYMKSFENGLTENEHDSVYFGRYNGRVAINTNEAEDFRWVDIGFLTKDLKENPSQYTYWFKIALPNVFGFIGLF